MPITRKAKETDEQGNETERCWTTFRHLPRWFVLAQTEGEATESEPLPDWELAQALAALDIQETSFRHPDGNTQGYATGRAIAINPIAEHPHRTRFHELAHVVLNHTDAEQLRTDGRQLSRDVAELEAECVALICCEALGLPGAAESRGYIQAWFKGSTVPRSKSDPPAPGHTSPAVGACQYRCSWSRCSLIVGAPSGRLLWATLRSAGLRDSGPRGWC